MRDEVLEGYKLHNGKTVKGYRVGDYGVRRTKRREELVDEFDTPHGTFRWLVDHLPSGRSLGAKGEAEAWFLADELAQNADGLNERQLSQFMEAAQDWGRHCFAGGRVPYRHWLRGIRSVEKDLG